MFNPIVPIAITTGVLGVAAIGLVVASKTMKNLFDDKEDNTSENSTKFKFNEDYKKLLAKYAHVLKHEDDDTAESVGPDLGDIDDIDNEFETDNDGDVIEAPHMSDIDEDDNEFEMDEDGDVIEAPRMSDIDDVENVAEEDVVEVPDEHLGPPSLDSIEEDDSADSSFVGIDFEGDDVGAPDISELSDDDDFESSAQDTRDEYEEEYDVDDEDYASPEELVDEDIIDEGSDKNSDLASEYDDDFQFDFEDGDRNDAE